MSQSPPDIAVRYIFRRPRWVDNNYGTNLEFVTGQVRVLPHDTALKFLRHTDTFEVAPDVAVKPKTDEDQTAAALASVKKTRAAEERREEELHELHDQIDRMNKESLVRFAAEKFNVTADRKHTLDELRIEAKKLVDRFGVT